MSQKKSKSQGASNCFSNPKNSVLLPESPGLIEEPESFEAESVSDVSSTDSEPGIAEPPAPKPRPAGSPMPTDLPPAMPEQQNLIATPVFESKAYEGFVPNDRPSRNAIYTDLEAARPVMKMTQACYRAVMEDLASRRFSRELGGMLLGPDDTEDLITHYVKDRYGKSTTASFTIDHQALNEEIRRVRPARMICVGLVHSHPDGIARPSGGDLAFLERLFGPRKNRKGSQYFMFPIVCQQKLHPFIIDARNVQRVLAAELVLI